MRSIETDIVQTLGSRIGRLAATGLAVVAIYSGIDSGSGYAYAKGSTPTITPTATSTPDARGIQTADVRAIAAIQARIDALQDTPTPTPTPEDVIVIPRGDYNKAVNEGVTISLTALAKQNPTPTSTPRPTPIFTPTPTMRTESGGGLPWVPWGLALVGSGLAGLAAVAYTLRKEIAGARKRVGNRFGGTPPSAAP